MAKSQPCDLYLFYDIDGNLLYVGISLSAVARASQHRSNAAWWRRVARMDVVHCVSRRHAAELERATIMGRRPMYNVVYNSDPPTPDAPICRGREGNCGSHVEMYRTASGELKPRSSMLCNACRRAGQRHRGALPHDVTRSDGCIANTKRVSCYVPAMGQDFGGPL